MSSVEDSSSPPSSEAWKGPSKAANTGRSSKLRLASLVFLIYYSVSGGAFGIEQVVQAAHPRYAILGFSLILVWAVPEALVTAELSAALPEPSGSVAWVYVAFGRFWGFQKGWLSWLSGVSDNSLYPILFLDSLVSLMNMYSGPDGEPSSFACGYPRWTFIVVATAVLTYINYRGLEFVGQAATFICVFTLLPFIVFCIVGIPQMDASKLLATPPGGIAGVNWRLLLNTFFWNINYWESAASYSGDVEDPGRNYPLGLMIAVVLVALSLILPLVVAIGASALPYDQWADGSFAGIAMEIAGPWLGHWMMAASAVTNIGMFEAEMSSDAWQVAGMADRGILPKFLSSRNKFGAPTFGIALSATGVLCLAWLSFEEIVDILNLLFCLGQIIEFLAFLELRRSHEHLHRPFRIPVGLLGACVLMTLPLVFIGIILYFSTPQTLVLAGVCSVLGVVVYYLLEVARQREWVEFCPLQELSYSTSQKSLLYTQSPSASCRASAPSIAGGFQCDSYGAMDALRALSEGNKSTSAAAHSDCLHSETETSPLLP